MRCADCGAEMVPMIFTSFCPNDCDRKKEVQPPVKASPEWGDYDTGNAVISEDGRP